jgi:hypothetical protein
LSCPTESSRLLTNRLRKSPGNPKDPEKQIPATNSTPELVKTPTQNANIDMSAKAVTNQDTETKTVRKGADEIFGLQPKYLRHNLWQEGSPLSPTTAEWSETAKPLPRPPLLEVLNPITSKTIADHPDLFQVRTPIKR